MRQKLVELFDIIFGFRKFIAWLALFLVAIIFRLKGLTNGSQFTDLIKGTFLAFCAANGFEHVAGVAKEYVSSQNRASQPDKEDK